MAPLGSASSLLAQTIDPLPIAPNRAELMHYLGYGQAARDPSLPEAFEQALQDGFAVLQPRGTFSIYSIESCQSDRLSLGGASLAGQVATFLRSATRIAVFVATVGQPITELSREASAKGDIASSWALDALGSWAAEAAVDALLLEVARHAETCEALSARFSPGYCGMSLSQQAVLFGLVDAHDVNVSLLPSMLMQPLKSVSGLVGIGSQRLLEPLGAPCETCDLEHCIMRR